MLILINFFIHFFTYFLSWEGWKDGEASLRGKNCFSLLLWCRFLRFPLARHFTSLRQQFPLKTFSLDETRWKFILGWLVEEIFSFYLILREATKLLRFQSKLIFWTFQTVEGNRWREQFVRRKISLFFEWNILKVFLPSITRLELLEGFLTEKVQFFWTLYSRMNHHNIIIKANTFLNCIKLTFSF